MSEIENYLIHTANRTNGLLVEDGIVIKASAVFKRLKDHSLWFVLNYCRRKELLIEKVQCYFNCSFCGTRFFRDRANQNRGAGKYSYDEGPFCNRICFSRWRSQNYVGENNPNFVEQSNSRNGGQFERNRLKALERDKYKCIRCGSNHRLQVHHKDPWADNQIDPHRLENLETLCQSCHLKSHFDLKDEHEKIEHIARLIKGRWGDAGLEVFRK